MTLWSAMCIIVANLWNAGRCNVCTLWIVNPGSPAYMHERAVDGLDTLWIAVVKIFVMANGCAAI
jgi:hypothetical protein